MPELYGIKIGVDTSDSLSKINELTKAIEKLTTAVEVCQIAFQKLAEVDKPKEPIINHERVILRPALKWRDF